MNLPSFETIKGEQKILFSAPHSHPHKRPNLSGVLKQYEKGTDEIVKEVCKAGKFSGIYLSRIEDDYDPNYHKVERNEYKREVERIVKDEKVQRFVDIHGLCEKKQYDFELQYSMRFQRSKRLALEIVSLLSKEREFKDCIFVLQYLPEDDKETLVEFVCRRLDIPAVQLEIAKYIREDDRLKEILVNSISKLSVIN